MEIIRNCMHFNSIFTALECDETGKPSWVYKSSFEGEGIQFIKNEIKGLEWYSSIQAISSDSVVSLVRSQKKYIQAKIKYHSGNSGNLYTPLEYNFNKILNAIDYHIKIFEKNEQCYSHGDYSLENIIFNNDEVMWICDWESFNKELPQGFDIIYCIMEACYFQYLIKNSLNEKQVDLIRELLRYASEKIPVQDDIFKKPASYLKNLSTINQDIFGSQWLKYPILASSDELIQHIDSFFQH